MPLSSYHGLLLESPPGLAGRPTDPYGLLIVAHEDLNLEAYDPKLFLKYFNLSLSLNIKLMSF
jgi:hypothetical protein